MIWSHLRILREKARAVIHTGCLWNYVSQKVPNDFICYLMNKYELYLTFSIIIISLTPDRDWDGAAECRAKPFTARASSDWDVFLRSAFLETADQTSQSNYRPIMIDTRSIGAPVHETFPTYIWHCTPFTHKHADDSTLLYSKKLLQKVFQLLIFSLTWWMS